MRVTSKSIQIRMVSALFCAAAALGPVAAQETEGEPPDPIAALLVETEREPAPEIIVEPADDQADDIDDTEGAGDANTSNDIAATPANDSDATPPMWRVADEDSEFWLLGTFHILPPDLNWRTGALPLVLDQADVYYFEVEGDAADSKQRTLSILMTDGYNKDGVKLSDMLEPDDVQRLREIAAELSTPMAALDPMRPWQAFLALSVQFIIDQGFEPGKGADTVLMAEARARNKDVKFFETIEQQLGFFTNLPPASEKDLLVLTIQDWDAQKERFDDLFDAWRSGNIHAIDENMNETMRDQAPEIFKTLIVDRNKAWARIIANDIRTGAGKALVAVGAAHMAGGENSLPDLLLAKGFDVERIDSAGHEPLEAMDP